MADFSTLIATLQATIKTNYNQEITGQILQDDLLAMVNTINQLKQDTLEGYGFYGAPLADGASVNVTQNTFFLVGPGTYTINGEANTIAGAGISVLVYDSVNDEVRVDTLISYDTTPTAASKNAITSGAVHTALAAKQDKDTDAVAGNVAVMNASGDSEDGGVPLSDLATKEDVEAVEQEVAQIAGEAGLAEAVIDTDNAGTEQEFTFRKSGGDGGAYYRKIKGKTIVVDAQLASNDAEAVETTGANQWDEEWESGGLDNIGQPTIDPNKIRSKNYIPVIGGQTYYAKFPQGMIVHYYDNNKGSISEDLWGNGDTKVMPINCAFIKFYPYPGNMTTYNHDICINLSNPAINGQYFPYWKRTLQLGLTTRKDTDGNVPLADGMKGAGTAADWADKVGGEKRMGRVDLGSLEWTYEEHIQGGSGAKSGFSADIPVGLDNSNGVSALPNCICSRYTRCTSEDAYVGNADHAVTYFNGYNRLFIIDSGAGSDPAAFKAAMNGVMLDYELATPVPFTWAEPLNLGVKVDENGTERAVQPAGATNPSAPFVADTTYTMSVARMVEILQNI